ncbi:MAG: DMT family transporter [Panacagrimonas sp.]
MSPWLYLSIAICAEVIATSALNASAGFAKPLPSTVVVIGYGIAFWCLSLSLRSIPMGIVYAIWSGVGIVLISIIGWIVFRQALDVAAMLGMGLIVAGVLVINLFSRTVAR